MEWAKAYFETFLDLGMSSTCAERKDKQVGARSEVCYFISYPKGTYDWYFYDPREPKVFVSTNAIFLEDDYIMSHKPKGRILLEEVIREPLDFPTVNSNMEKENTVTLPSSAPVPRSSGRIVRELDRFMFLGKAFEAVSENLESDPTRYEETMADSDSSHWVKAMKAKIESMDSNQVWELVEPPANIKPTSCKCVYKIGRASCRERVFRAV